MCSHGSMAGWVVLVRVAAALPVFSLAGWHLEHVAFRCKLLWHGCSGHSISSSSESYDDDELDVESPFSSCCCFHFFHLLYSAMYDPVSPSGSNTTVIFIFLILLNCFILATILPLLCLVTLVIVLFKQLKKYEEDQR